MKQLLAHRIVVTFSKDSIESKSEYFDLMRYEDRARCRELINEWMARGVGYSVHSLTVELRRAK